MRAGQTEGAVDLMRQAGLKPAAVICEIMNDDGTMARVPQLLEFCEKHNLKITSIAKLVEYRLQREKQINRLECVNLPTDYGEFRLIAYQSITSVEPHLAICKGDIGLLDKKGNPVEHDAGDGAGAPDEAHDQGKTEPLPNNAKGEGEVKGEFRKGLKIHRGDREKLLEKETKIRPRHPPISPRSRASRMKAPRMLIPLKPRARMVPIFACSGGHCRIHGNHGTDDGAEREDDG